MDLLPQNYLMKVFHIYVDIKSYSGLKILGNTFADPAEFIYKSAIPYYAIGAFHLNSSERNYSISF